MKKFFRVAVILLSLSLVSCAAPVKHYTASGKPEVVIASTDLGAVKNTLISEMLNRGYSITKDSDFRIAFDRQVDNYVGRSTLG